MDAIGFGVSAINQRSDTNGVSNETNKKNYDFNLGWFDYSISGLMVILKSIKDEFREDLKDVYIPSTIRIDDEDYYIWFSHDCSEFFKRCTLLKNLKVEANTTRVDCIDRMFESCWSLTTVNFKSTFNYLVSAVSCFEGCSYLKEVNMKIDGEILTNIDNMFCDDIELTKVTIDVLKEPRNLLSKDCLFKNCDKLQYVHTGALSLN